jgi:hypothetical protein
MAADATTTVRVRRTDGERLQDLARRQHMTVVEVVRRAVDALEREEFLRALDEDFRRLRLDTDTWGAYLSEQDIWRVR